MSEFPAPLVAADVDCTDLDGFMLNVERLMSSELWALSTGEELKAALALWCRAWKQVPAASLPDDPRVLAAFAGVPASRWKKVQEMALRVFVKCSDGRIYHPVLAKEALNAWERKTSFRRKREQDAERLRDWRTKQRSDNPETPRETPIEAQVKRVSSPSETRDVAEGQGQGQGQGHLSKKDGGDSAGERDPIREALNAIGAWDDPNCRIHGARVPEWIRQGADLDLDILPTLRDVIAKARESEGPHWLPSSMNFFDKPISRAIARRTKPLPEGETHHGETNQARSVGRAERIAAALAGVAPRTCPVDP